MTSSNEKMHMLKNVLKLTDNGALNNLDEINAALTLLAHKEELQKEIWKRFLRAKLICGDGFTLADCESSDLATDKHTLLRVNNKGTTVAWVCVQDNLYLYCKETKKEALQNWHGVAGSGYQWIHLAPEGRKIYPMKDCSLKDEDIDICKILQEISCV